MPSSEERQHPPCEVIIVGGGISALIAARELLAAGSRVDIYERRQRRWLGGQCLDAFGGMLFVNSPEQRRVGIRDSLQLAWEDWQSYAELGPESEHQRAWARRYLERCLPDVRSWLIERGLRFLPIANWAERSREGRGNRVPRFHLLWGCGPALVGSMLRELAPYEGSRLQIRCEHRVDQLIIESGRVLGVRGSGPSGEFEARAERVVIAAGGWTGDLEKVRARWPRAEWGKPPQELLCGVWPEIDGHMHEVAAAAGAALSGLEHMWVYAAGVRHWEGDFPEHGLALIPPKSGLWLAADGARFSPPLLAGYDTRAAVGRITRSEHPWSWMVCNRDILAREIAIQGARFNPAFRERSWLALAGDLLRGNRALAGELIERCEDVVCARDLDTLAARMSALTPQAPINAAALARDVGAYDAEIARGARFFCDPQLVSLRNVRAFLGDRLRTASFRPIAAGAESELVAIRLRPVVRKSLGGIITDEHCRALRADHSALPGLYAIGEAAGFGGGGMNGKRTLEGTLLGGCVLTARVLAQSIRAGW
ncbi:MAG TPA: FAD-dependent oxidoreductase [Solirubrobacteraceae bacterium]|nr:FAD-dependent oxidoreductase [Solirubrobacteraceae bacterium]